MKPPPPVPPIKLKLKLGGGGGVTSSVRPPSNPNSHDDWDEDDLLHSIDRDNERSGSNSTASSLDTSSNTTNTPPTTASKRRKTNPKLSSNSTTTTSLTSTPTAISTPSGLKLKLNLGGARPGLSDSPSNPQGHGRGRKRSSPPLPSQGVDSRTETIPTLPAGSSSTSTSNSNSTSTSTPKIKFNIKKPLPHPPPQTPTSTSTPPPQPSTQTPTSKSTKKSKPRKDTPVQQRDQPSTPILGASTPRLKVKFPIRRQGSVDRSADAGIVGEGADGIRDQDPEADDAQDGFGVEDSVDDEKEEEGGPGSTPSRPSAKAGKKTKVLKFKTPSTIPSSGSGPPNEPPSTPSTPNNADQDAQPTGHSTPTPSKSRKQKKPQPSPASSIGSPGAQSVGAVTVGKGGKVRPKSKLREELGVSSSGLVEGEGVGDGGEVEKGKVEDGEEDVKREIVGAEAGASAGSADAVDGESVMAGKQESHPDAEAVVDIKPDFQTTDQDAEQGGDDDGRDGDEMDYGEDELDLLSTPMDLDSASSSPHPNRTPRGKGSNRHKKPFAFRKKPLPHLLHTIIANLRRKDAYGLFFDPVSLDEYPNYFEVIGGEGEAMDLGTMEGKVDRGEYRDMAEFESDVDKMITAAQKFNPDDTLVHREAAKVAQLAARQFVRFRGLVKTPSPSPERETPTSGLWTPAFELAGSVGPTPSNRSVSPTGTTYKESGGSMERPAVVALQPRQMVPEGMLDYPPNSDIARCVGWYLTGGKRPRTKKEQRAKEKWDGTWREWNAEGYRDVREADNIMDLLRDGFTFETSGDKITFPRTVDWQDESMNATEVWQPTPTLTGIVSDEVVPSVPYRSIDHLDWGRYQNLAGSYGFPEHKGYDVRKFLHDLEVDLDSVWRDEERADQTERPVKVVKDMCLGEDLAAEAYVRSIDAFVAGARGWVDEEPCERKRKREETSEEEPKRPAKRNPAFAHFDASGFDLGMPLSDYVGQKWRGGWLQAGMRGTVRQTQAAYRQLLQDEEKVDEKAATMKDSDELVTDADIASYTRDLYIDAVRDAAKRIPIAVEIEAYGARQNGLDLACLLHIPSDFAAGGSAMGPPPNSGPGRAAWYEKSLQLAGQQIVDAAKRRETMAEEEVKGETELAKLTRLRLDLLSLAKNVPVYELRPMTPEEVELLPPAVRGLIKVVPRA